MAYNLSNKNNDECETTPASASQPLNDLLCCPHCGGAVVLMLEGKLFTKRYGRKVQYGRIICKNNEPLNTLKGKHRCLCKTVAAPVEEVLKHWAMRAA